MSYIPRPSLFFILSQSLVKLLVYSSWVQICNLPTPVSENAGITGVHCHIWLCSLFFYPCVRLYPGRFPLKIPLKVFDVCVQVIPSIHEFYSHLECGWPLFNVGLKQKLKESNQMISALTEI